MGKKNEQRNWLQTQLYNLHIVIWRFRRFLMMDAPCCKGHKMQRSGMHKPDAWGGGGTLIYKCEKCGKEWF